MDLAYNMWIHGHSMQIEDPDGLRSIHRYGSSIRVEGEQDATPWFHFAIPTPTIVGMDSLRLEFVMLRFNLGNSTRIQQVHVYDGEEKLTELNDLPGYPTVPLGKWYTGWYRVPDRPNVSYGLGISVMVHFLGVPVTSEESHCVHFSSAGMRYSYVELEEYAVPPQPLNP